MKYEFYSRKFRRKLRFTAIGDDIFIDLNRKPGTLGYQIRCGGNLLGLSISAPRGDQARFEKICRSWWSQCLRNHREEDKQW